MLRHGDEGVATDAGSWRGWRSGWSGRRKKLTIVRQHLGAQVLSDLVFTRKPPIDSGLGNVEVSAHLRDRMLEVNAQASKLDAQHRRVCIRVQPNDLR